MLVLLACQAKQIARNAYLAAARSGRLLNDTPAGCQAM